MQRALLTLIAISALATGVMAGESTYDAISGHYEVIRQALLHDGTADVSARAAEIEKAAKKLHDAFDAKAAGVDSDKAEACKALLPGIADAAARVKAAGTIEDARTAFYDLSKEMVRYRQMVPQPDSVVVYCSMAEKLWVQPEGEIGNPYYGQSMARCGEVVSR